MDDETMSADDGRSQQMVILGKLEVTTGAIAQDVRDIKGEVAETRKTQARLETDVAVLRRDLASTQDDVAAIMDARRVEAANRSWVVWGQSAGAIVSILGTIVIVVLWLGQK